MVLTSLALLALIILSMAIWRSGFDVAYRSSRGLGVLPPALPVNRCMSATIAFRSWWSAGTPHVPSRPLAPGGWIGGSACFRRDWSSCFTNC